MTIFNGTSGADSLVGSAGNDTLSGGKGNDRLNGGLGSDLYTFSKGDGVDTISKYDYRDGEEHFIDTVQFLDVKSTEITAIERQVNSLVLKYGTTDQLTLANYFLNAEFKIDLFKFSDGITWDAAALMAQEFSATGTASNDFIAADHPETRNHLSGLAGHDTLYGGAMNDRIEGGAGNDVLMGFAGRDTLNGGTGRDFLNGGAGNDLYLFAKGDGVDIVHDYDAAAGNIDTVQFLDVKSTGITSIEHQGNNLVLKYGTADQLTLTSYFNSAGDKIEQFKFSDGVTWNEAALKAQVFTFKGSVGNDTIFGHDEGGNRIFGLDGDDELLGSEMADRIEGGAGNDDLYGGYSAGNDTLNGGTGTDWLDGSGGKDLYLFAKGDGVDKLFDYDAYSTGDSLDTVQFLDVKSTEITAIWRLGDNLVLKYGTTDQLTISLYFDSEFCKIEQFKFSDGVIWNEADLLAQVFTYTGTASGDSIGANHDQGSNLIFGLDGNDTLSGDAMADRINGGTGNDNLYGFAGNDTLNGGTGNDTLNGGDGNDTYYVDSSLDIVQETNAVVSTGGIDRVNSYLAAYTLGANVENGRILATDMADLTGNALNNVLYAGTGSDVLDGAAGTDTVSYRYASAGVTVSLATAAAQATGGSGSDTLLNVERLTGSSHADRLTGNTGNNTLNGGTGNDLLNGGAGNDVLIGALGADRLTGGTGADRFDFNNLTELGLSSTTWDTIVDFKTSEGDRIDLLGVDANTALAGDQAFSLLGTVSAFSGDATGRLRFDAINHILYGSTDADISAEFAIALTGVSSVSAANFVL